MITTSYILGKKKKKKRKKTHLMSSLCKRYRKVYKYIQLHYFFFHAVEIIDIYTYKNIYTHTQLRHNNIPL